MLFDNSESMAIENDLVTKSTIFNEMKQTLEAKISNRYKIVDYQFAANLSGDKSSTYINKTLKSIYEKHPTSRIKQIFLFSDGWFKDQDYSAIQKLTTPINCLNPSIDRSDHDLSINRIEQNQTAYLEDLNPVKIEVQAFGYEQKATLELTFDGKQLRKEVDFSKLDFQEISFDLKFTNPGLQKIMVDLSSDSIEETNLSNNRINSAILVEQKRNRVLVISDQLNWDTRFLQKAIKADSKFESKVLLKNNNLYNGNQIIRLSEEIKDTDLLILASYKNLRFNPIELKLIRKFQSIGGSIIFIGDNNPQLADIYPTNASSIRTRFESPITLTAEAAKYETFSIETKDIPPISYRYLSAKKGSKILATFDNEQNSPFIIMSDQNGKILQIAGTNLWRWQMQKESGEYEKLIQNLTNWFSSKSNDNFISTSDKSSYNSGETVKIELVAYDEKLNKLTDLDAKISLYIDDKEITNKYLRSTNDKFATSFNDLKHGDYTYKIRDDKSRKTTSGEFVIIDNNSESRDFGINSPILDYISSSTGGALINSQNIDQLEYNDEVEELENKIEIPIYKKIWLILVFILSFCLELFWRKRWGLL